MRSEQNQTVNKEPAELVALLAEHGWQELDDRRFAEFLDHAFDATIALEDGPSC